MSQGGSEAVEKDSSNNNGPKKEQIDKEMINVFKIDNGQKKGFNSANQAGARTHKNLF